MLLSELPLSSPLPFVVAVTGHRNLTSSEAAWLEANAGALLGDIEAYVGVPLPATPVCLVSGLAAGTDQKFAAAAVARETIALHVLLPFACEAYRARLIHGMPIVTHAAILDEFDRLRACADTVVELDTGAPPPGDRSWVERRYASLGAALVARADLLVALWRGDPARGPGGTAEVVAWAAATALPTLRLDPNGPGRGMESAAMDAVRLAVAGYEARLGRPEAATSQG